MSQLKEERQSILSTLDLTNCNELREALLLRLSNISDEIFNLKEEAKKEKPNGGQLKAIFYLGNPLELEGLKSKLKPNKEQIQAAIDNAIEEQNYEEAARLRDILNNMQ